jgi:S1-C subfamily serine protease
MISIADDLKPEDLYKQSLPSVMTLTVDKKDGSEALGTAFLTIKDGVAATAWHVVKDAVKVSAKFSSGEQFEVSGLIDKDEKRDIALVRVKVAGRPLITLASTEPAIGSKAYVIGAPQGLEFSLSDGLISQVQMIDNVKNYQFTCAASPGNSGGPIMNASGAALGVVSKQMVEGQNLNFAVPSTYVLGLDSTLPTQPWIQVKEDKEVTPGSVTLSDYDTDKLLADAILNGVDDSMVVKVTWMNFHTSVYDDKHRWQLVVPYYLYLYSEQTQSVLKRLTSLKAGGYRHNAAESLIADLTHWSEVMDMLMKCITQVQHDGCWTTEAQNLASQIIAKCSLSLDHRLSADDLKSLFASKGFINHIPEDMQYQLGIVTDMVGYALGINAFTSSPMHLINVEEDSPAYSLGLRSDDIILSVDDKQCISGHEFKAYLKQKRGQTVHVIVMRAGKEKKIKMHIPDDLGKRAE